MITKSILYKIYNKSVHCTFSLTIVYLKMLKKGLYIILLLNFIVPDAETWYTNPLDYAISRITKRTTFREPISFTPFFSIILSTSVNAVLPPCIAARS